MADASAGLGHGLVGMEIDLLVFDRAPKPLNEDVVPPSALAFGIAWAIALAYLVVANLGLV